MKDYMPDQSGEGSRCPSTIRRPETLSVFLYIRERMIGDHYVFEEIKEGGRKEKGERK